MSATTVACRTCGKTFDRPRHSNQHHRTSDLRMRSAAYCSPGCKQAGYRVRKGISAAVTRAAESPSAGPQGAQTDVPATRVRAAVTRTSKQTLDPLIVPDEKWPGMYRIKLPGGGLSDMVNLTRARDATRILREGAS
jgi:hypothetical protein